MEWGIYLESGVFEFFYFFLEITIDQQNGLVNHLKYYKYYISISTDDILSLQINTFLRLTE